MTTIELELALEAVRCFTLLTVIYLLIKRR